LQGTVVRINELCPEPTSAEPLEIPSELMDSVMRHQANLAALIASMQVAGLGENIVQASVRTLIDSYAEELTTAIRAMIKGQNNE
jgi:hypothetical protein